MMTPQEHYEKAEEMLTRATETYHGQDRAEYLQLAHIHALLANVRQPGFWTQPAQPEEDYDNPPW